LALKLTDASEMSPGDETDLLLRQAWTALGGDPALLDLVQFTGDGTGLLPSNTAALPAMTAAMTASTLAASLLDAARGTGAPKRVFIDREHVAVAARSEYYARSAALEEPDRMSPFFRFWMTADGRWFRVHGEYPWHRSRALAVLQCEDRHRSVKDAISRWRAEDLEDALDAAGGLGYAVRSEQEWLEHPQGRAVAALPLLQSEAGTGTGRLADASRGATGLRVLDLTRALAGPIATRTLAAWGAEVVRIDGPGLPEEPAHALDTLPGKRSAELDLADPANRTTLEELLGGADLLVQGYRPGALARFGLDARTLSERHPHLNVITLSAWGPSGPWATRRGFDSVVQCPVGISQVEGTGDRPGALPSRVLDHAMGYLAAAASMLAVASVQHGGSPQSVQLSLAQTARWLLGVGTTSRGEPRRPDVDAYRVVLPGAVAPVDVVRPPGRLVDLEPSWSFTTDLGADAPEFSAARQT
jgi:crotonobetainyl-CoA:carnitine CoA-transferase CaiB-like acyl-CoA transferase